MLLAIAADPIGRKADWHGLGDKHRWQALAATFDVARLFQQGLGMGSRLVVRVDCTASGLQHLAALTLDEVAGEAVNLTPASSTMAAPKDVYAQVAALLPGKLSEYASASFEPKHSALATIWIDMLRGRQGMMRDLAKLAVMVIPYGGTTGGTGDAIRAWMTENAITDPRLFR